MLPQAVDVRDVAQLLRYSVENPEETNGERYIASSSSSHPQAIADILREEFKADAKTLARILEVTPGKGYSFDYQSIDGQGGLMLIAVRRGRCWREDSGSRIGRVWSIRRRAS